MKLNLDVKKLKPILSGIFRCVNASTVLPILENVMVEVKDKKITYTVTDLETSIQYTDDCDCEDFSTTIPAKKFLHFILNAFDDVSFLEVCGSERVKLCCGDFKITIPNESAVLYPKITNVQDDNSINFTSGDLIPKFTTALRFVSKDYLRPAMTGVHCHVVDGVIKIAATDAHCLYFDEISKVSKEFKSFILSSKSTTLLVNNFKKGEVTIISDGTHVAFKNDNLTMQCRSIDARYPDYDRVIPVNDLNFFVKRKQFLSMIKLASEYTNSANNQVIFNVVKDKVYASGESIDFGFDFEYNMPLYNPSIPVANFKFAFNLKFMKKTLESGKDEYVKINHSQTSTKAFIIDDKFLIMPIMTD